MLVAEVPCDINLCNENSSVVDASQDHSITIAGEQGSVPHSDSSCPESSSWPMYSKMRKDDAADVKCIRLDISFKSPSHTGLRTSELVISSFLFYCAGICVPTFCASNKFSPRNLILIPILPTVLIVTI